MSSRSQNLLHLLAASSLLLAACAGCTSWFQPRSHELMRTTKRLSDEDGHPAPLPRELSKSLMIEHRLEPGDVLLVEPAEFDASIRLSGDQTVQPDGAIELGQFGRLPVAGKTTEEVQADVERLVSETSKKEVAVNVRLVEMNGKVVYVLGEVSSPGAYPLKGNETVLDAIIAAGGITDQADQSRVILNKPTAPVDCRVVLPVCYKHIVQLGDTSTNYQLEPGDRIYVPSRSFCRAVFFFWLPDRENCPRCASPQYACPPGMSAIEHVDIEHIEPIPQVEEVPVPQASTRAARRSSRLRRITAASRQ
jgi:polysaccharide export outer membrane protein